MKKAIVFLIIAVVAVGIVFGIYLWQQAQTVIIRVEYIECLGCGCDIYIVENEQSWPPGKQVASEVPTSVAEECLSKYQKIDNSPEDDYLLTVKGLKELKNCIKESEVSGREFIKVDDIYGEWPIYYNKLVEFEGYVVFDYKCQPIPEGATEACFDPYFSVAEKPRTDGNRYFEAGQIIVKNIFAEEVKEDHKYLIRGKLLPPEQADLIDIVGIVTKGSLPVIEPTQPAIEIIK